VSLVRLGPVWMTNHPPSVLWHCWLGHQTCKSRRPYNPYCVGADIKPCSINQLGIVQLTFDIGPLNVNVSGAMMVETVSPRPQQESDASWLTPAPYAELMLNVDIGDIQTDGRTSLKAPFPLCRAGLYDYDLFHAMLRVNAAWLTRLESSS